MTYKRDSTYSCNTWLILVCHPLPCDLKCVTTSGASLMVTGTFYVVISTGIKALRNLIFSKPSSATLYWRIKP